MKKNILNTLAAAFLTGVVAMSGLTACSSDDNILGEQPATVKAYQVNIAANINEAQTRAVSFDNDATPKPTATGHFDASERIYVYNETKNAMLDGYLSPSDISADGKSCNLTGSLTGTIEENDKLTLAYNMNDYYSTSPSSCAFDYNRQDGTESSVVDAGMVTGVSATIDDGKLTTTTTVSFAMLQAIFRLKFTDGTDPIAVKRLVVESTTAPHIAYYYFPFRPEEHQRYNSPSMVVTPTSPTSDYLYVAVCITDVGSPSALRFTVTDADDNSYTATKTAPAQGFKNGKYYYSSAPIALEKQTLAKPTITWNSAIAEDPNAYNCYEVRGPWSGSSYTSSEITISGISLGYRFYMYFGSTVHLNNFTAIYDDNRAFMYSQVNLNLDISGTNTITNRHWNQAISAEGTLKLSGNGTLTITAKNADMCGFNSNNYNSSNNSDPSVLAASDKTTVTRSERTDNADGTYTWTYTVVTQP